MYKAYGTGRRTTSSARVYLNEGNGAKTINSRDVANLVQSKALKSYLLAPLQTAQLEGKIDLKINVAVGGSSRPVGAIVHGLTRALIKYQSDLLPILRREGFVTRDARKVERKKVGLRKARKATQFSKR